VWSQVVSVHSEDLTPVIATNLPILRFPSLPSSLATLTLEPPPRLGRGQETWWRPGGTSIQWGLVASISCLSHALYPRSRVLVLLYLQALGPLTAQRDCEAET
jgi:hypothetical protein